MQHGDIELDVVFVAPDEDSDDQNNDYEDENGFRLGLWLQCLCDKVALDRIIWF